MTVQLQTINFKCNFIKEIHLILLHIHWNLFLGCNWREIIVGFDNDLVSQKPQDMIYANDDAVWQCIYVAQMGKVLTNGS